MRKIISIHHVSLDGVIQSPGGLEEDTSNGFKHGGWAAPFEDDLIGDELNKLISSDFDLLLGRLTYEIWNSYWPLHLENPIGKAFNEATKFVATNTLNSFEWVNTKGISGDVAEEIRKLKQTDGPHLHVWGSGKLMQTLLTNDLVDEIRHWVFPIVIGEGKRFFDAGVPPRTLSLVESRTTPAGTQINTYHPAGPLKTGSLV